MINFLFKFGQPLLVKWIFYNPLSPSQWIHMFCRWILELSLFFLPEKSFKSSRIGFIVFFQDYTIIVMSVFPANVSFISKIPTNFAKAWWWWCKIGNWTKLTDTIYCTILQEFIDELIAAAAVRFHIKMWFQKIFTLNSIFGKNQPHEARRN